MLKFIKSHFKPYYFLFIFTAIFFRKMALGFIPIPFNFLVQWFFPYNNGGWQAAGIFTQFKGGQFASDAIRQIYPWRQLATEMLKNGELPLWNPYAFSGTPLLANMQTAIFYPLNILFYIIPSFPWAWAAYIALPVLLSGLFMYKFLTLIGIRKISAVLGSLAFSSSGYMVNWLEWGVIPNAIMWLPLSLFAVKRWFDAQQNKYLLLLIFSGVSTVLAGYPQGSAYSLIIVATYVLFNLRNTEKSKRSKLTSPLIISAVFIIGISSIQWLPTMELFFNSAMKGKVSQTLSRETSMPLPHFATLLAPDYFGNRVTENYWAKTFSNLDYMDADLFISVSALPLLIIALLTRKKRKETSWLIWLVVLGILLGGRTPISAFIAWLGIPVLGTGAAAEALIMLIFANCCLAAFGFDQLKEGISKKILISSLGFIALLYMILAAATFYFNSEHALIARRNLIIPASAFLIISIAILISQKSKRLVKLSSIFIISILSFELIMHANKILPFSSVNLAYPKHILIEELQNITMLDRTAGFWETEIATNFHTAFRIYSAEGYDPLYIRRYGEFISSAKTGELTKNIPRSDADITMENETNRNRLIDLTSIKFIPAKVTDPTQEWEEEPLKYDPERFKLVWQKDRFKIYENLHALPRIKLFSKWQVIKEDEKIIKTLYDPSFDYQNTVILEEDPQIDPYPETSGKAEISKYGSSQVEINVESQIPSILLLTDSFYKGWKATINEKPTEILRANYNFRAIIIPQGKHKVIFKYQPFSVKIGKLISVLSLISVFLFFIIFQKNKIK